MEAATKIKDTTFKMNKATKKKKKNLAIHLVNRKVLEGMTNAVLIDQQTPYELEEESNSFNKIRNVSLNSEQNYSILPNYKPLLKFAISHALEIFNSKSIYTFIPKNACSTMRYSVALSNGFIRGSKDLNWIHNNNLTLSVKDLTVLLNPSYSFVILRCPYARLVSVFLDKFLTGKPSALNFIKKYMENTDVDDISFQDFIYRISELERYDLNEHWRPQVDFLLYKTYTRYFSLESINNMITVLEQDIGFKVLDTRAIIGHHTSIKRKLTDLYEPWKLSIKELKKFSALPSINSMFSRDLVKKVSKIYHEDIELYTDKFGRENLSFK